jgi:Spy/CpxP family protein refolding chaperone
MHEQRLKFYDFGASGRSDDAAARKAYEAMSEARKAMFENSLEARKRIEAVLTKEQRQQARSGWGCY